jgi:hypothetical protein
MADTQRDGRDGRTNGGSADRPDRGRRSGCRPGAVAGGKPGGMAARSHNGRACSGHGSGFSCWGCWTTFPSCRRAPVRPVVAGSKHPEVHLRLSENGSVEPSFVMRPWAMVVTSLRPDGWKRLTTRHGSRSRQRGPDVGSVRIEFHLRPCIDAKRSNRAGKSLASGGRRRSALQQAGGWTRPDLVVCGGAPRRNRTGDPILTTYPRPTAMPSSVFVGRGAP